MKVVLQDSPRYVLRFDKGEEVFQELIGFAEKNQITAAVFWGIGTVSEADLGFYNPFLKQYRSKPVVENFEIISLTGNLATLNGKPTVHAHGSFGRTDFSVIGGHVFKLVTLATCEIFLIKLTGEIRRKNHPDFQLNLMD